MHYHLTYQNGQILIVYINLALFWRIWNNKIRTKMLSFKYLWWHKIWNCHNAVSDKNAGWNCLASPSPINSPLLFSKKTKFKSAQTQELKKVYDQHEKVHKNAQEKLTKVSLHTLLCYNIIQVFEIFSPSDNNSAKFMSVGVTGTNHFSL